MEATRDNSPLKSALLNQYNLILLGGTAAFSAAFSSPWPLVAGGVGEVVWLAVGSSSTRFRRWSSRQAEGGLRSRRLGEIAEASRELEAPYLSRAQALSGLATEIRRLSQERGVERALLETTRDGVQDRLDGLLLAFVKMAALHQRLARYATEPHLGPIEEEMTRLGQALADEKDPSVRLSLRQALGLGQRRLKQHEQIESQRRGLGVKMGTLEMSFDYLRSHVWSGSSEPELAAEINDLLAGAAFLPAAEAEANAQLARMQSPVVTRTITTQALGDS